MLKQFVLESHLGLQNNISEYKISFERYTLMVISHIFKLNHFHGYYANICVKYIMRYLQDNIYVIRLNILVLSRIQVK